MSNKISKEGKKELVGVLKDRYRSSTKEEKSRILDEFIVVSGYHRKYATRLLSETAPQNKNSQQPRVGRRIYDEAVKEALIVLWEATDRICAKRLKAILPELIAAMERHGHLEPAPEVKKQLLRVSPATIDRLLAPVRSKTGTRRKRRAVKKVSKSIPVRTFGDWHDPSPGHLEIDFVAHSGGSMAGAFIHTLVGTDICSGWTECVPLLVREQSLVVEGLEELFYQTPFPIKGIDSDNDSSFINETLLAFCQRRGIEFTRCRAYRKNDQAWVEQKNGAVVRRLVGYERFSGVIAGQTLAHLYRSARLHVNYFQPSFKLVSKSKIGSRIKRKYEPPTTPCERLLQHPGVEDTVKANLRSVRDHLDPLELLHRIREGQAALAKLVSEENTSRGPCKKTLEQFLAELPTLWMAGEPRPTHRKTTTGKTRHWRTREDPFESVWLEVLQWLQTDPDTTAKALFQRLQAEHPGCFQDGQLRTLQRRVREWRQLMARQLLYSCMRESGQNVEDERLIGTPKIE